MRYMIVCLLLSIPFPELVHGYMGESFSELLKRYGTPLETLPTGTSTIAIGDQIVTFRTQKLDLVVVLAGVTSNGEMYQYTNPGPVEAFRPPMTEKDAVAFLKLNGEGSAWQPHDIPEVDRFSFLPFIQTSSSFPEAIGWKRADGKAQALLVEKRTLIVLRTTPMNPALARKKASIREVKYERDRLSRVQSETWPDFKIQYGYDAGGNRTMVEITYEGRAIRRLFQYDALDRISSYTTFSGVSTNKISFVMDRNGNRIQRREGKVIVNYSFDALNRLTKAELAPAHP